MEHLETQERVISLGKKLVNSFKKNDPDEITIWMIHYIAEQIELAESTGNDEAKKECFNTILKLWESQAFPRGTKPFENFESIFKALESLSPENANARYFISQIMDEIASEDLKGSTTWLQMAKQTDESARVLISFFLKQAVNEAMNEELNEWLQALSDSVEVNAIEYIINFTNDEDINKVQQRIELLNNRLKKLKQFESQSKIVQTALKDEILALEKLNIK